MKFKFMDPQVIMGVVVALIILAVGVFAVFVTFDSIPVTGMSTTGRSSINNSTSTASSVFNIVGVVLVIGAIMSIIGMVYGYMRPGRY